MPIAWTNNRAARVAEQIEAHPASSGRCAALGRALLPLARAEDADAAGIVVRPVGGQSRYACMRPSGHHLYWFHHVTTGLQAHFVDALTGVTGTPDDIYLATHFSNAPGDLVLDRSDPHLANPRL